MSIQPLVPLLVFVLLCCCWIWLNLNLLKDEQQYRVSSYIINLNLITLDNYDWLNC